jgi:para-nitrobenzyl esterase
MSSRGFPTEPIQARAGSWRRSRPNLGLEYARLRSLGRVPRRSDRRPECPRQDRSLTPGGPVSEDCLYLNVWTPGLRDGAKRPMMVYMHGGGFGAYAANFDIYDGVNLCRRGDVVVVSLNHRLNTFGYIYLAELGGLEFADLGNLGQLDLILASRWVRDNITEFGGDPDRVLIFGQSGGGAKWPP